MTKNEILLFLFVYLSVLILPKLYKRKSVYLGLSEDSFLIKNIYTRTLIMCFSMSVMLYSIYLAFRIYIEWWS
jgi:hypothetical protein